MTNNRTTLSVSFKLNNKHCNKTIAFRIHIRMFYTRNQDSWHGWKYLRRKVKQFQNMEHNILLLKSIIIIIIIEYSNENMFILWIYNFVIFSWFEISQWFRCFVFENIFVQFQRRKIENFKGKEVFWSFL